MSPNSVLSNNGHEWLKMAGNTLDEGNEPFALLSMNIAFLLRCKWLVSREDEIGEGNKIVDNG